MEEKKLTMDLTKKKNFLKLVVNTAKHGYSGEKNT